MTCPSGSSSDRSVRARCSPRAWIVFFAFFATLLAADLAIKHWAFANVADEPATPERDAEGRLEPLPHHEPTVLIPSVLALHLTLNEGAVFGLGAGGRWVFVAFTIVASIALLIGFQRTRATAWGIHLLLAGILAGAIGNLYDRLAFGAVRDMLWLFPGVKLPFRWHWPNGRDDVYPWIFNVADACLMIGLIALMIVMYRVDQRNDNAKRKQHETTDAHG